jgi:hypothetical protein
MKKIDRSCFSKPSMQSVRFLMTSNFKLWPALAVSLVFLVTPLRAQFAYVTNFHDNTVSGYSITSNGALTPVPGSPFAAGDGPRSVAVDPTDRFAYVANSNFVTGLSFEVSAFSIGFNGALTPISGSPFVAGNLPNSLAVTLLVPFVTSFPKLEINAGSPPGFDLNESFTLGTNSNGINPVTENATLLIGTFSGNDSGGLLQADSPRKICLRGGHQRREFTSSDCPARQQYVHIQGRGHRSELERPQESGHCGIDYWDRFRQHHRYSATPLTNPSRKSIADHATRIAGSGWVLPATSYRDPQFLSLPIPTPVFEHPLSVALVILAGILPVNLAVLFVGCADLLSVCSVVSALLLQGSFSVLEVTEPTNPCVLSCQTDFLMSDAETSCRRCPLQIPFAKNFATSLPVTAFQTVLSVDLLPPFLSCLYSSVTMLKS